MSVCRAQGKEGGTGAFTADEAPGSQSDSEYAGLLPIALGNEKENSGGSVGGRGGEHSKGKSPRSDQVDVSQVPAAVPVDPSSQLQRKGSSGGGLFGGGGFGSALFS